MTYEECVAKVFKYLSKCKQGKTCKEIENATKLTRSQVNQAMTHKLFKRTSVKNVNFFEVRKNDIQVPKMSEAISEGG